MKEITEKLHSKALTDFLPVIEQMASQGCSRGEIVSAFNSHIRVKVKHYYKRVLQPLRECIDLPGIQKADSKAEMIFYEMLQRSGIKFTFQHTIGRYRVDYLVNGFLVIEIDGPQHEQKRDEHRDAYLRRMGYKIIRIPIWALVSCPEAAVNAIKEAQEA